MSTRDSYIFFDEDTAFQGEVSTDHLVLKGVITGDVRASKDVILKQGSLVQGEISTKKYTIEEGSIHQGKLRMDINGKSPNGKNGSIENNSKSEANNSTSFSKFNGTHHTNGKHGSHSSEITVVPDALQVNQEERHTTKISQFANGQHKRDSDENNEKSVFELINKVRESISEAEPTGHASQTDYNEPPPRERLW